MICRLFELAGIAVWVAITYRHAVCPVRAIICLVEEAGVFGPVRDPHGYPVAQVIWSSDDLHDEVDELVVLDVGKETEAVSDVHGELGSGGKVLSVRNILLINGVIEPYDIFMLLFPRVSADTAWRASEGARHRLRRAWPGNLPGLVNVYIGTI